MHFAIWIALFVVVYLLIAFNIGQNKEDKQQTKLDRMKSDYFYYNRYIKHSVTLERLEELMPVIEEHFFNKHFEREQKNKELQQYYSFLLRAMSEKRKEFNGIQEVIA